MSHDASRTGVARVPLETSFSPVRAELRIEYHWLLITFAFDTEGRFEQLHCPKQIDGSLCGDPACKYSHVAIGASSFIFLFASILMFVQSDESKRLAS